MTALQVAIRVDASAAAATGHAVRCLTLADELASRGVKVRFLSRELPPYLRSRIARDHQLTMLSSPAGPPGVTEASVQAQVNDAAATHEAMKQAGPWAWLVVDHYGLADAWERAMMPVGSRILVIDDLANRHHHCDVLLDQNFQNDAASRYRDLVPAGCEFLLGPRYAMLRPEFRQVREVERSRVSVGRRLLVAFGGVDAGNHTGRTLRALRRLSGAAEVEVVVGALHAHREEVAAICESEGYTLHIQTARMAQVMAGADLAIGAGGSTSWERCCMGLPAICVPTSEAERPVAAGLAATGAAMLADGGVAYEEELAEIVPRLLGDPERLATMSRAAMGLVDGNGVTRVASIMLRGS